jgi:hypothetical protein
MKNLSVISGALGVLFFLLAVAGRFHEQATVSMLGHTFRAGTFLVVADTFLLIGIFLYLMTDRRRG